MVLILIKLTIVHIKNIKILFNLPSFYFYSRGRFTPEEDKKIMIFMNSSNIDKRSKICELSKILRRTYISIFKRYQTLLEAKTNKKRRNKLCKSFFNSIGSKLILLTRK